MEVVWELGDSSFFYEQPTRHSLPVLPRFAHAKFEYPGTASFDREYITEMDNDSLIGYLYLGSERDSTVPSGFRGGTYVAEFNPVANNCQKVWSMR